MITRPPPPVRRPIIHRPGFRHRLSSSGPTGRTRVPPIYSWNHSPLPDHSAHHPPPRVSPWAIIRRPYRPHRGAAHLFVGSFAPTGSFGPSSTTPSSPAQGFALGYRPAALQAVLGYPPFIREIIRPYRIIRAIIHHPIIPRPGFRPGLSSGGPTGRTGVPPIYS